MKATDWPATEIERVASSSGKPLEVSCALEFKKRQWTADLGSYFADGVADVPRELDVLVSKEIELATKADRIKCGVRVLVSCKGFRSSCAPLAYSVSRNQIAGFSHHFLIGFRGNLDLQGAENSLATAFINSADLHEARKLVAYDVIERADSGAAKKKPTAASYKSTGDRAIYAGFDSALKAALYWRRADSRRLEPNAMLYIPVLLLGRPFWNVPIDDGTIGKAIIQRRGYQTCSYPVPGSGNESITTAVWCAEELPQLVKVLDDIFVEFVDRCRG